MSLNSFTARCNYWRGGVGPIPGKPTLPAKFLVKEGLEETAGPLASSLFADESGVDLQTETLWIDSFGEVRKTDPLFEAECDGKTTSMLEVGRLFGKSTAEIVHLLIAEDRFFDETWSDSEASTNFDSDDEEEVEPAEEYFRSYDSLFYHQFNPTVLQGHLYGN